jgi:type IV fimbrial biogenesis protein FimT
MLHEGLVHARETAIMRNVRVIVCPSPDGKICVTTTDWQNGWLIATDADHDNQPDRGKGPLATFDALPRQFRVRGSTGRPRVVFHPDGSAAGTNAHLTICRLGDTREGSAVIVSNSGRVREADAQPDRLEDCLAGTG